MEAVRANEGRLAGLLYSREGLEELLEEIMELLRDDHVDTQLVALDLASPRRSDIHGLQGTVVQIPNPKTGLPSGRTEFVSKPQVIRFTGGESSAGGIYDVEFFWKATDMIDLGN